ncbi:YheC/YheD family protein [Paenibacillus sp. YPG26]|uniref:YheC/YheD family protein n=1 Tax=Paenibacillus sp. YPG26 TaxID=2878915 RepID=UPI00203B27AA|nr:YheC/YheD family protein [Paenibacillus sp. YPG26]USB32531.1 YheC/YheD family protein [Paenibacillus sp. YPG26]
MAGRQLANKWLKTEALLTDKRIQRHIPQTSMYSASNMKRMLQKHRMVVIKPIRGGGGYGVIKVVSSGGGYSITHMADTRSFRSFEAMERSLSRIKVRRPYIIQQGIQLATIAGRPIDYRVKVAKGAKGWEYRAMVGRLARPGLFVTNLCKGGTQLPAREALARSGSSSSGRRERRRMRELTSRCTDILEQRFPGIGILGFDYGIDTQGRIWIFEVNTRPQ